MRDFSARYLVQQTPFSKQALGAAEGFLLAGLFGVSRGRTPKAKSGGRLPPAPTSRGLFFRDSWLRDGWRFVCPPPASTNPQSIDNVTTCGRWGLARSRRFRGRPASGRPSAYLNNRNGASCAARGNRDRW